MTIALILARVSLGPGDRLDGHFSSNHWRTPLPEEDGILEHEFDFMYHEAPLGGCFQDQRMNNPPGLIVWVRIG